MAPLKAFTVYCEKGTHTEIRKAHSKMRQVLTAKSESTKNRGGKEILLVLYLDGHT